MKKLSKFQFITAIFIGVNITACNNNEMFTSEDSINTKNIYSRALDAYENTYTMKFMYKGKTYNTEYTLIDDSIVSVKDSSIDSLLTAIESLPNLFTFLYSDGYIEYFDSKAAFHNELDRVIEYNIENAPKISNMIIPRSMHEPNTDYAANLYLWDDDNYSGKLREIHLGYDQSESVCSHLKQMSMNDKTTAFVAYANGRNVLFELYEDDNYKSHCFSFIPVLGNLEIINNEERNITPKILIGKVFAPDLKNVHVKGTNRSSWNDRITSVRISKI